jgi:glutathione peroxidase
MAIEFYDLSVRKPGGDVLRMREFEGKAVLIVNTATRCGLAPQFKDLEALHVKYRDSGLVVLGFPCNQFQNQEPESNESMEETCALDFGVSFQLTEKIHVNGPDTHPVFRYLKEQLPGKFGKRIKWNFTKFLVTPEGQPFKRFAPAFKPAKMEADIISLLPQAVENRKEG